jgi:plastocyanin
MTMLLWWRRLSSVECIALDFSLRFVPRGNVTKLLPKNTFLGKKNSQNGGQHMKLHIKFIFIACGAAVISLLSSRADTIPVQVGAGGLIFTPANVTIHVGDTIQWTWAGPSHSSTSGTPGQPDGMWDSGVHNTGFVFSHTFPTAGTFAYFCSVHGACCGMVGSATVTVIDTVQITRAQYAVARSQLTVQATDTNTTATLTVSVTSTGVVLGTMTNNGGGSYSAKFSGIANPTNITVTSNFGGTDSARVKAR